MDTLETIKTAWAHFNSRERRLLIAGGIFLGVFLLYFGFISPIRDSFNTQTQKLAEQQQLLQWMQATIPQLQALRKAGTRAQQNIPAGSLLSLTEQSLKQANLSNKITTLEKNPDDTQHESIQLKFDKVSFDDFMHWLIAFWTTYNIEITQISAVRTTDAGIAQVSVTISLPGAA